jgi:hypothetical protein
MCDRDWNFNTCRRHAPAVIFPTHCVANSPKVSYNSVLFGEVGRDSSVGIATRYGLDGPGQWRTQEFFSGGGSTNSVEDRGQNGDLGASPLVRGSGGSCNLVQEI